MKTIFILLSCFILMPFCIHTMSQKTHVPLHLIFSFYAQGSPQERIMDLAGTIIPGRTLYEAIVKLLIENAGQGIAPQDIHVISHNNVLYYTHQLMDLRVERSVKGKPILTGLNIENHQTISQKNPIKIMVKKKFSF